MGADLIANAIPLCRTHHWAFDRHLWGIHPETLEIHVRADAAKSLQSIAGKTITRPGPKGTESLAAKHLKWRWLQFTSM